MDLLIVSKTFSAYNRPVLSSIWNVTENKCNSEKAGIAEVKYKAAVYVSREVKEANL